jgi:hypothetical protein
MTDDRSEWLAGMGRRRPMAFYRTPAKAYHTKG